ncbi:MAG: helix-turn-helix domain-containing protein [Pseudomonadota bacterium]
MIVLLFDRVNAIDVAGPIEVFATARKACGAAPYETSTWSLDGRGVVTESGLQLLPDGAAEPVGHASTLIVPGGAGVREPESLRRLSAWLRANHASFDRIVSVCTGAYALAEAGLLDRRMIATHWAHAEDLRRRYPSIWVDADALFLGDAGIYTSGGVTSGIDLALELVARDLGHAAATAVARELVVFVRRSGKQSQFSEPLRMQSQAPDRLAEVCTWAANNLDKNLSVETLAERARLSQRQLSRRFHRTYGASPAAVVRRLRIDAARLLLEQGVTVQRAAAAVGFASVDGFRRAFDDVLGLSPRQYRDRFPLAGGSQ